MAKVRLTVRQLDNLGLWEKVREYKGWNPYIRNEGQIGDDEVVEFDDEFKKEEVKKLLIIEGLAVIENTEEDKSDYHGNWCGGKNIELTKEHLQLLIDGKCLGFNDGEYSHIISLCVE